MSLRTPLGRVLGLGSAKEGASHWYSQRVSAVAVALLSVWLLVSLLVLGTTGYDELVGWLRSPFNAALTALLIAALAHHATLGLQVVIEDYVGSKGTRVLLIVVVKFVMIVAAVVGVLSILRIAVGAPA
jgi:succinate dehydrogenase / fumarate reductase membrane anchor subunit